MGGGGLCVANWERTPTPSDCDAILSDCRWGSAGRKFDFALEEIVDGRATEQPQLPVSAPVLVGGNPGTISGPILYGGADQRIGPFGGLLACLVLGFAEPAP